MINTKKIYSSLLLLGCLSSPIISMDATAVKNYLHVPSQAYSSKHVAVGVIDTGFDENHPVLKNNIKTGFNARDLNYNVNASIVVDHRRHDYGKTTSHGTHVAGIIAQVGGKNVDIVPIKLGACGNRSNTGMHDALEYVSGCQEIKVINISMSMAYHYVESLKKIIDAGKIVVLSAGNDGRQINDGLNDFISSPRAKGRIIMSLAMENDIIANYSNIPGNALKNYSIATPGHVLSAVPGNRMEYMQGTSMSAPVLSACIARLWQEFPQATVDSVTAAILQSGRKTNSRGQYLSPTVYGQGIFDYENAQQILSNQHHRQGVEAIKWPVLNSNDPDKPIHKQIIGSIFGRPGEDYLGGQYMGKRFVAFGPGVDVSDNQKFLAKLPELRRSLENGDRVELRHVASAEDVAKWSKRVLYKVLVNGREVCDVVLFNREKVEGFEIVRIPASAQHAEGVKWPVLNSNDPDKSAHKRIIGSIFGRPGENYHGGQYMGKRFVAFGPGVDVSDNQKFLAKLPELRRSLENGDRIELRHVASAEDVAKWSKRVLYKVLVNGREVCDVVLFNREKIEGFEVVRIPPAGRNDEVRPPQNGRVEREIEGLPTIRLGHGLRTDGAVSDDEISRLMQKYSNNPVLNEAFKIVEGSDLGRAHDLKLLVEGIRANENVHINKEDLFNIMRNDRDIITRVANMFEAPYDDYETDYLPFLDQLNALGNHGEVYGYSGRYGIDKAIIMIRENPELLKGRIPAHLQNVTGKKAINLRLALFYVDMAKKRKSGQGFDLSKLVTFCPGDYFGGSSKIKQLLSQTSFYQNGVFYSPENGYVKNGDRSVTIPASELSGLKLRWENGRSGSRKIVFADCSGFAQMVARVFHPNNQALQNDRYMSYQLAPLYDALINEQQGTSGKFFDINGYYRPLNSSERNAIANNQRTINKLRSVFKPVLDPMENIRPGDILVERGGGEGHVMIVVEQDPRDPSLVTILELTSCGDSRGYKWRKVRLRDGERKHRVLRIKQ